MYTLTVASINSKLICYHVLNLNVSLSIATSSDDKLFLNLVIRGHNPSFKVNFE